MIGHRSGEITLDLDEADPARGEEIRATLGEHYRTPLGHIRHELGHFVWLTLVAPRPGPPGRVPRTCSATSAPTTPPPSTSHYARVDDGTWRADHASFYASAHPWEDFAESWAQLMHVHDVVETGAAWGVVAAPDDPTDAKAWLATSITASLAANELARAMGMRDLYPFALSPGVRAKVEFCWRLVRLGDLTGSAGSARAAGQSQIAWWVWASKKCRRSVATTMSTSSSTRTRDRGLKRAMSVGGALAGQLLRGVGVAGVDASWRRSPCAPSAPSRAPRRASPWP